MLITFLIALFISFIGSMPFGMINMAVANTSIHRGVRAGIFMGLGASLVELFQVFIALKFTWLFKEGGLFGSIIQVIAILVFFSAGIYFLFFAKSETKKTEVIIISKRRHEFIKGVGIGSVNVIIIPYWIFYGSLLMEYGWLEKENKDVIVFSLGAMLGAFLLLAIYAYLGDRVLRKSETITRWVNKFIGIILIGFGVYQLLELLIADS